MLSYDIRNRGALHDAVAMEYLELPTAVAREGAMLPVDHTRL